MANISIWPIFWLAVGVAAAIVEGLSVQLLAIWFAVSAGITALAAAWGIPVQWQWILFVVLSFALLAVSRPILKKRMTVRKESTNADMVLGKTGTVIRERDGAFAARVSVMGMEWAAEAEDGTPLTLEAKVIIKAIEGAKLIVALPAVPEQENKIE